MGVAEVALATPFEVPSSPDFTQCACCASRCTHRHSWRHRATGTVDVAIVSAQSELPRIVINSCARYRIALVRLLHSLEVAFFQQFDRLVIVIGGCGADSEPQLEPLSKWLPHRRNNVVVIRCALENFDYHGLAMLHEHSAHPLIRANAYLYLLDTTSAEPDFVTCFEALRGSGSEAWLLVSSPPASNICAFGLGVVQAYGTNFASPVSKAQAIAVEHGESSGCAMRGLQQYATHSLRHARPRVFRGTRDVYGTGGPKRWVYHYPTFGVCKYVLMRLEGGSVGMDAPGDII